MYIIKYVCIIILHLNFQVLRQQQTIMHPWNHFQQPRKLGLSCSQQQQLDSFHWWNLTSAEHVTHLVSRYYIDCNFTFRFICFTFCKKLFHNKIVHAQYKCFFILFLCFSFAWRGNEKKCLLNLTNLNISKEETLAKYIFILSYFVNFYKFKSCILIS